MTGSRTRAFRLAVAATMSGAALVVAAVVALAWEGASLTGTADCKNITVTAHESNNKDFAAHPTGTLVFSGPTSFQAQYTWDTSKPDTVQVIATVPLTASIKDGGYTVALQSDSSLKSDVFAVSRASCSSSPPPPSPPPPSGQGGGTHTDTPSPAGTPVATTPGLPHTGEAPGS